MTVILFSPENVSENYQWKKVSIFVIVCLRIPAHPLPLAARKILATRMIAAVLCGCQCLGLVLV